MKKETLDRLSRKLEEVVGGDFYDKIQKSKVKTDNYNNIIIGDVYTDIIFTGHDAIVFFDSGVKADAQIQVGDNALLYVGEKAFISKSNITCLDNSSLVFKERNGIFEAGIKCGKNTSIYLDKEVKLERLSKIITIFGTIQIGESTHIGEEAEIICFQKIKIGKKCHFSKRLVIRNHLASEVIIGDDCLFSWEVTVISGDGHAIYDLEEKRLCNLDNGADNILIESHVWVGVGTTILGKSTIEHGG